MNPKRIVAFFAIVAIGLLASAGADAASISIAASSGHRGGFSGSHGGSHGVPAGRHGGQYYGHYSRPYWGWGWGLALGLPLAWGWYNPYWGSAYYPYYSYGPAYRGYSNACEEFDDCWGDRRAYPETPAPTTQVPPPAVAGAPTERPLHLNYCESARAYFPAVTSCPEGWRMTRPRFN